VNIVLWVIAGVLAAAFLGAGWVHLTRPREELAKRGMGWTDDVSPGVVKLIGGLEILAAVGLILPGALHVVPVLVPLAALGLVILMAGAMTLHARRKEPQAIVTNLILLALAAVVVWGRFGPHAF
jgi:hypothetical protein